MKYSSFNNWSQKINKRTLCVLLLIPLLFSCNEQKKSASFSRILERGYVSVGTIFGPNSYYAQADGYAGFEYELAKKYAHYLNVELKIVPSYSLDELFIKLNTGEVDILAAGLSVTDKRLSRFRFAPSYEQVSQKLVYKQGKVRPRELNDLEGKLMVTTSSSHVENLEVLKQKNNELEWLETSEFDSEELLLKILSEEIDYTVIDSNALAVNRRY